MTVADAISAEVVIRRVRRALAKRGLKLRAARRPPTQRELEARDGDDWQGCFRWNLVDAASGRVLLADLRLDSFADALGCVQYWEIPTGFPSPGPGF